MQHEDRVRKDEIEHRRRFADCSTAPLQQFAATARAPNVLAEAIEDDDAIDEEPRDRFVVEIFRVVALEEGLDHELPVARARLADIFESHVIVQREGSEIGVDLLSQVRTNVDRSARVEHRPDDAVANLARKRDEAA